MVVVFVDFGLGKGRFLGGGGSVGVEEFDVFVEVGDGGGW